MRRPLITQSIIIKSIEFISFKLSLIMSDNDSMFEDLQGSSSPQLPIQSIRLLGSNIFQIRVIGLDKKRKIIFSQPFDSDGLGNFNFKIAVDEISNRIDLFQIFEIKQLPGIELYLGSQFMIDVTQSQKIIISDFDKTLVDTRYSNTKEVYRSLTSPLCDFPSLDNSIAILKNHIASNYHPFILSASPHFYRGALRDWLYQNQIYTAGIFLKDIRQLFSLTEGILAPKDFKVQGLFKMNHLLDILLMTGIPHKMTLIGDNFESDPLIYVSLLQLMQDRHDPWDVWNRLRQDASFKLTNRQNSHFLAKIYQLQNHLQSYKQEHNTTPELTIYIRKKEEGDKLKLPAKLINNYKHHLHPYMGSTL
jgi:hypothetical protein